METAVRVTSSICCYCGTGCGVRIHSRGERVLAVEGDESHPSSLGQLCGKGLNLTATVRHDQGRILAAQWRADRSQPRREIALSDAYDIAAAKLAETIAMHGPDAIGFYLSGQLLTEDYTVFNKLARALIGTNNIDSNSRLCMSSAVSGYSLTLGADAPPACYEDLEHANAVLIAGSNMAYAHPVLFRRLEAAKTRRPDMKIIVVDPRRTDTASIADLHLAIQPGTDVALFHAMLNVLVWEDLIDRSYIANHTRGFAALKQRIREFTPSAAQDVCGVAASDIVQAARWFGEAKAALSLYTMGLNQSCSGTAKNAALIHLHLATGHIGRPGTGPFSLTGQPNAMGGREAGGMATLLPGHRKPGDAAHREEVARLWGVDRLPEQPGKTAIDMFDAVLAGDIKVLWIAATNPAQSLPDTGRVHAALEKAELVIVQEAYANTETLAFADLVLPAATWPEKSGTVTNSERRISRVRAAINPPGNARPDWEIVCAVARRLAGHIAPHKTELFNYANEAAVFAEHARCTAGRDLDYSALTHAILERDGPQQWPYAGVGTQASARLYADGNFPTDDGRAHFYDTGYVPVAENISPHYPLHLTTGRMRDQWHTLTRTGLVPALMRHVEEPCVYLNANDLRRYRLQEGGLARVRTRRGQVILPVAVDEGLQPGHAFLHMHWGSGFIAGTGVNALACSARDPASRQPELKHSAANVAPVEMTWHAQAWIKGCAVTLRTRLMPWLRRFPYAVLVPSALGGEGVRLRLASAAAPDRKTLDHLIHDLGLDAADLAFDDPARGIVRRLLRDIPALSTVAAAGAASTRTPAGTTTGALTAMPGATPAASHIALPSPPRQADAQISTGALRAWLLTGDVRAAPALLDWTQTGTPSAPPGQLLSGRSVLVARARIICSCASVTDQAIVQGLEQGLDLNGLKTKLNCGASCGTCLPQVRQLAGQYARTHAAPNSTEHIS